MQELGIRGLVGRGSGAVFKSPMYLINSVCSDFKILELILCLIRSMQR